MEWRRSDEACRRISDVPVVGLLTATAAVAVIGNARTFKSGREFAAYLGLVPRQNGSGGKVKLGGISKRGDVSISAARARRADPTGEGGHFDRWLKRLSRRDAVECVDLLLLFALTAIAGSAAMRPSTSTAAACSMPRRFSTRSSNKVRKARLFFVLRHFTPKCLMAGAIISLCNAKIPSRSTYTGKRNLPGEKCNHL